MNNLFKGLLLVTLVYCNVGNINANDILNNEYNYDLFSDFNLTTENNLKNDNNININQNKTIKILSLDGGGTRGYLQAKFLDRFCQDADIDNIGEYFDLIAGTSAGSLNAMALVNDITPNDIMNFYRSKSPWIFTIRSVKDIFSNNASVPSNKPNAFQQFLMMLFSNPFYKSVSQTSNYGNARLRMELHDAFGDKLLTSIKTPVLLTAYNDSEYYPLMFTNANLNHIPDTFRNIKIVDAIMASMSAPVFLPSTELHLSLDANASAQHIVDGALFQNNPSLLALTAAKALYPSAENYFLLSIGTGSGEIGLHLDVDDPEPSMNTTLQYTRLYSTMMYNSSVANEIFFKEISKPLHKSNIHYYRFNFKLDNNIDCDFTTSTTEFFNYLDSAVIKQYDKDQSKIEAFINNINKENNK
ncbi:MAG: patatin-like phospholipase family protein [Alphaproteobacteria bacterium]|nr:patatin-like phospholipase family protein [Alphaproteobacteria bacterium]